MPIEDEEKFVVIVMFMPVIRPLHNPKTYYRIVHLAKGLVVPTIRAAGDQRWNIDYAESREQDVQVRGIWVLLRFTHKAFL
jgi:hypothetical protein